MDFQPGFIGSFFWMSLEFDFFYLKYLCTIYNDVYKIVNQTCPYNSYIELIYLRTGPIWGIAATVDCEILRPIHPNYSYVRIFFAHPLGWYEIIFPITNK